MYCFTQQTELVLQHHQAMLDHMLPALCEVVGAPAESGDTRFFCLRMVSDVTQLFLLDTELYGTPTAASPEQRTGIATAAVDSLLQGCILPMVPQLLKDEDPMPLYALKVCVVLPRLRYRLHADRIRVHLQLLGGLLEVNVQYVQAVESMGLAAQFFEFLSLEHSNNNVHNIRLCRQIIAAGSMPVSVLGTMQVAEKVSNNCIVIGTHTGRITHTT